MAEDNTGKSKWKRELIEWGIMLSVLAALYVTGLHTEVLGTLQRGLLATGLFNPDTHIEQNEIKDAYFDMPLVSIDGERTALGEFEGKTIFLNFWATWCAPCIAEMPNIQKLANQLQDTEVAFVMISVDDDPQKARDFVARKGYDFPVYFMAGRRPSVFNSTAIPTTYVISPSGEIILEKRGMANYNNEEFRDFLLAL